MRLFDFFPHSHADAFIVTRERCDVVEEVRVMLSIFCVFNRRGLIPPLPFLLLTKLPRETLRVVNKNDPAF